VIEFCSDSNHDPDQDIQQEIRNGDSCWETIVARPGYTGRTAPDPAGPGPTTGFTPPDWIFLEKQPRFAVMVDARHGAVYWLEYCSVGNDLLSVIAYDDQIESLPTRAAVQVGLLITDGIHNFPAGSSPVEALEDYRRAGSGSTPLASASPEPWTWRCSTAWPRGPVDARSPWGTTSRA
jgi:hypothetical protein